MKLRNKKTGEIVDFAKGNFISSKDYGFVVYRDGGRGIEYNSLAELNEEWEDVPEEPKKYWFIDAFGNIVLNEITKHRGDEYTDMTNDYENQKQIGNYFETKEEAEKAVEKLKAWKRLKDKGFRFLGVRNIGKVIDFDIPKPYNRVGFDRYFRSETEKEFFDDLLFLFGGEE